jgi:hypothetical protein
VTFITNDRSLLGNGNQNCVNLVLANDRYLRQRIMLVTCRKTLFTECKIRSKRENCKKVSAMLSDWAEVHKSRGEVRLIRRYGTPLTLH